MVTVFVILGKQQTMKKPMPYEFLLDYLPAGINVKPAIGMFYIYFAGKIVFIFRETTKNPQYNGIWISTKREYHNSFKDGFPAVTEFDLEEGFDTTWLLLNNTHDDFESTAIALCELVAQKDERIGKVTPASAALFH